MWSGSCDVGPDSLRLILAINCLVRSGLWGCVVALFGKVFLGFWVSCGWALIWVYFWGCHAGLGSGGQARTMLNLSTCFSLFRRNVSVVLICGFGPDRL